MLGKLLGKAHGEGSSRQYIMYVRQLFVYLCT
jgi:hypothetical protein